MLVHLDSSRFGEIQLCFEVLNLRCANVVRSGDVKLELIAQLCFETILSNCRKRRIARFQKRNIRVKRIGKKKRHVFNIVRIAEERIGVEDVPQTNSRFRVKLVQVKLLSVAEESAALVLNSVHGGDAFHIDVA